MTYDPPTDIQMAEIKSQVHKYLKGDIDEIDVSNFLVEEDYNTDSIPFYSKKEAMKMSSEEAVFNPKSAIELLFIFFFNVKDCVLVFIPFLLFWKLEETFPQS